MTSQGEVDSVCTICKSRPILIQIETEQFITYYLGQDLLWNTHYVSYSKRDHGQAAIKKTRYPRQVRICDRVTSYENRPLLVSSGLK